MVTYYVILGLCVIVILAYLFDITFKYSKIPGVVLLIILGIAMQLVVKYTGISIPNMRPVLPILGTLGLILIVMDASLEIKLQKNKTKILTKSIMASFLLLFVFVAILTIVVVKMWKLPLIPSLVNAIPLGIISSAVAISSSSLLNSEKREFITFESSISDILGILAFDFILLNEGSLGSGLISFAWKGIITILIAAVMTSVLAFMLHKIKYHVNYIIILTSVVMIYVLAKLVHLPGLFLVIVFGLALSNNHLMENTPVNRFVNFDKFREDINSFKKILAELTFLVRSLFFILFGFYTNLGGLFKIESLLFASSIIVAIYALRWAYFTFIVRDGSDQLVWFAPRGLITILLFLSIPDALRIKQINEEVVTLVILMSIFVMMIGNMLGGRTKPVEHEVFPEPVQENTITGG